MFKTCHTAVLEYLFFPATLLTRSSSDNKILQCFLKINSLEIDTQSDKINPFSHSCLPSAFTKMKKAGMVALHVQPVQVICRISLL